MRASWPCCWPRPDHEQKRFPSVSVLLFGVLVENNQVVIGALGCSSLGGSVLRGVFFFGGEARSPEDRNSGRDRQR